MSRICALCLVIFLGSITLVRGAELSSPGTLRGNVPDDALAYLRIPGPFAAVLAQRGPGLRDALADPRINAALETIRNTFVARIADMPAELREPISSLLLGHLRSPVEAIAMLITVKKRPQPIGLITMELDLTSVAAANQLIRELESASPNLSYLAPMAPGQPGVLSFSGAAVGVSFEPSMRRLSLIVGPALSRDLVLKLLNLPANPGHPMRVAESQIDDTGHGLFVWANVQRAMPFIQLGVEPALLVELEQWGALNASSLAFGMGTAGGNGKIRMQVDVPRTGLLRLLPIANHNVGVRTRGEPGMAVVLGGVHADATTRIEQLVGTFGTRNDAREFRAGIAEMAVEAGFSIDDVFAALGPHMVGFTDDAGEFLAVAIRDRQRLGQLLQATAQLPHVTWTTRRSGNATIHHLRQAPNAAPEEDPYMSMLQAASVVQLFWVEEDDYLVFGALPQSLRDRYAQRPNFALRPWLKRNAGSPISSAAVMLSARFDDIPRFLYTQYLGGIYALAAMTQADVDLYALPSAAELGLPPDSALALSLQMSAEQLALELSFDGSPLDVLVAPGASGAVAVVGVLAAIAIPAYQDYTIRARVQESVSLTIPARTAAGIACSEGSLRVGMSNAALGLPAPGQIQGTYTVAVRLQVESRTGVTVIARTRNLSGGLEDGQTIEYAGVCGKDGMRWRVGGTLPEKYRPKS